jgi:hypothetical protein
LKIERRTLETLVGLDYTGNYGEVDGDENTNNHRLYAEYQVFLTRQFYLIPLAFEAYRDPFLNIKTRLTPSAGAGHYIFDRADIEWKVSGLFGYQFTTYDSVGPDEDRREAQSAMIVKSEAEVELADDWDLELDYQIQKSLEAGGSTNHHAYAGLSVELNDVLDLTVGFTWERVGSPERDSAGELPENNDYRLTVGLKIDF